MVKRRVLLISIAPPCNDCGGRIVLHRHLVEHSPYDLHVASNADSVPNALIHTHLELPYFLQRLRKSRFGPRMRKWLMDYENLVWPMRTNKQLDDVISAFRPELIMALADNSLSKLAFKAAQKHKLPIAGLFLDWFPRMAPQLGHRFTSRPLDRWYRSFYRKCDLAFCTSDGMQTVLGSHPNSHVIYPMPGAHRAVEQSSRDGRSKFRIVYVGSVESFYGRMLCRLIEAAKQSSTVEVTVVGPNADWPEDILSYARQQGIYLGFRPPQEAAPILQSADGLLVVMSFEKEHELFMRTSFTTKFLDYVGFEKPILLWGPDYCTPSVVAKREDAAVVLNTPDANAVIAAAEQLSQSPALQEHYVNASRKMKNSLFSPTRLQNIFTTEVDRLIAARS